MALPSRCTDLQVQALLIDIDPNIITNTYPGVNSFEQWRNSANEVVNNIIVAVDSTYSVNLLTLIETYLSAHFYSLYDPRASYETVSSVRATYDGKTGMLLEWSRYGQGAILLDYGGYLANMNYLMSVGKFRRRLGIIWLGQPCPPKPDVGYQIFPSPGLDQSS